MRAPLIPTLLLVLATSFGSVAYAVDSAADLSVQLSIVALKANDNVGAPSFATTMEMNGLTIPVTVTRDANGALIITPVVDENGLIAATDANGNPAPINAAAVPAKFNLTVTTNASGAVVVQSMTITTTEGTSVTLAALPAVAGEAASFVVTAGDTSALAGVVDPASAPVATAAQQQAVAEAGGEASTVGDAVQAPSEQQTETNVAQNESFVPPPIVVVQEATNQTDAGNVANNPSPSTTP